jgi:hypothetical protein
MNVDPETSSRAADPSADLQAAPAAAPAAATQPFDVAADAAPQVPFDATKVDGPTVPATEPVQVDQADANMAQRVQGSVAMPPAGQVPQPTVAGSHQSAEQQQLALAGAEDKSNAALGVSLMDTTSAIAQAQKDANEKSQLAKQQALEDDRVQQLINQKRYDDNRAEETNRQRDVDADTKDMLNMKVDPSRLFHGNTGAGATIFAVLAGLLGTAGSYFSKDPVNHGIESVNRVIDKDIEAQKANISNKQRALQQKQESLKDFHSNIVDDAIHENQMRADGYTKAMAMVDVIAHGSDNEIVQQNANKARAEIQKKIDETTHATATLRADQQAKREQQAAMVAAQASNRAYAEQVKDADSLRKVQEGTALAEAKENAKNGGNGNGNPNQLQTIVKNYTASIPHDANGNPTGDMPGSSSNAALGAATNMVSRTYQTDHAQLVEMAKGALLQQGSRVLDPAQAMIQFFGSEHPSNDQIKDGIYRAKKIAMAPKAGGSRGAGSQSDDETGDK